MSDDRISVRLGSDLYIVLQRESERSGKPVSELIREMIEERYGKKPSAKEESVYDVLMRAGVIGCAADLPADLSTNKKYMEDFGKDAGENPH